MSLLFSAVKPEAWLSTGSHPGPDRQMLVCRVSGFHPKPIWVKWMRGEQVQQGTQQSDVLPNADGTWYLQVLLEVEATETSGLYCRVRHSSLGGQDILLYLGEKKVGPTLGMGGDGPQAEQESHVKHLGLMASRPKRMKIINSINRRVENERPAQVGRC